MPAAPVSVLIATYNEAKHIEQCLRSLLAQTYAPIEILVADDGSTDDTLDRAGRAAPSAKLLRLPHRGKAPTLNEAAEKAAGDILIFLDGDMWVEPDYVRQMARPILEGEAIGTSHEQEYVANPDNPWASSLQKLHRLPPRSRFVLSDEDRRKGSTIYRAVRREAFLRVGGFDDTGFLDDQTLFPKLKVPAAFVRDAVCHHYNVETLGEVFSSGKWAGKSTALRFGPKSVVRHNPVTALVESIRSGTRHQSPRMAVFSLVYEWGQFVGITSLILGSRSRGK